MKKLFDPVINQILQLIAQQLGEVQKQKAPEIKVSRVLAEGSGNTHDRTQNLILVGGFGDSQYLWKGIKAFCEENGNIYPIIPMQP